VDAAYYVAVQSQCCVSGPIPNRLGIVKMRPVRTDNSTYPYRKWKLSIVCCNDQNAAAKCASVYGC